MMRWRWRDDLRHKASELERMKLKNSETAQREKQKPKEHLMIINTLLVVVCRSSWTLVPACAKTIITFSGVSYSPFLSGFPSSSTTSKAIITSFLLASSCTSSGKQFSMRLRLAGMPTKQACFDPNKLLMFVLLRIDDKTEMKKTF